MKRLARPLTLVLAAALSACAHQVPSAVDHAATTPGFLLGVWHGFIFPVAWGAQPLHARHRDLCGPQQRRLV